LSVVLELDPALLVARDTGALDLEDGVVGGDAEAGIVVDGTVLDEEGRVLREDGSGSGALAEGDSAEVDGRTGRNGEGRVVARALEGRALPGSGEDGNGTPIIDGGGALVGAPSSELMEDDDESFVLHLGEGVGEGGVLLAGPDMHQEVGEAGPLGDVAGGQVEAFALVVGDTGPTRELGGVADGSDPIAGADLPVGSSPVGSLPSVAEPVGSPVGSVSLPLSATPSRHWSLPWTKPSHSWGWDRSSPHPHGA
jgi:hypothetical protein